MLLSIWNYSISFTIQYVMLQEGNRIRSIQSPSTNVNMNHKEYNFAWFQIRPTAPPSAPPLPIFPDNEIENFSQRVKRRVNAKPRRATVLGTGSLGWTAHLHGVPYFERALLFLIAVTASRVIIALLKPNMKFAITFITDYTNSSPNSTPHQVWSTHDSFETFAPRFRRDHFFDSLATD